MLEKALRLCDAAFGILFVREGLQFRGAATCNLFLFASVASQMNDRSKVRGLHSGRPVLQHSPAGFAGLVDGDHYFGSHQTPRWSREDSNRLARRWEIRALDARRGCSAMEGAKRRFSLQGVREANIRTVRLAHVRAVQYLLVSIIGNPDCRIIFARLGICNLTALGQVPRLAFVHRSRGDRQGPSMKILVIEDDSETADYVANGLSEEGHQVASAKTGSEALAIAMEENFELLIVDRMIPGLDGLQLVRALRAADHDVPVLFLTALGGVEDRVSALTAGGDDYLMKPFAFSELTARVAALGRRPRTAAAETSLRVDDLEIDLVSRTARRGDEPIDLQPREYRLLEYLMRHAGQVVTRTMLLEHVWDLHFDPRTNVVETLVSRLRSKIDKGFGPELIYTVRGAGYCLRGPA